MILTAQSTAVDLWANDIPKTLMRGPRASSQGISKDHEIPTSANLVSREMSELGPWQVPTVYPATPALSPPDIANLLPMPYANRGRSDHSFTGTNAKCKAIER